MDIGRKCEGGRVVAGLEQAKPGKQLGRAGRAAQSPTNAQPSGPVLSGGTASAAIIGRLRDQVRNWNPKIRGICRSARAVLRTQRIRSDGRSCRQDPRPQQERQRHQARPGRVDATRASLQRRARPADCISVGSGEMCHHREAGFAGPGQRRLASRPPSAERAKKRSSRPAARRPRLSCQGATTRQGRSSFISAESRAER